MRTILFPGSFNPFTRGHADIVERALALFDTVIIAVGCNDQKADSPSASSRVEAIQALYRDNPRVQVTAYHTLTATLATELGADALLRSVRSVKDYEYEMQMADINRHLTGIDTVILFARPSLAAISSSVVRELQRHGCDVSSLLP